MRQNDGSEILGPNDPRNLVIGIIHVSPNDDRQSVITAITTQDRLGRDQIVLDLPAQNKSFNSSVDFEGLHQMASEIEASLVLVAPQKSKIANLARRESFTVYPSLDELASAEFPPLEEENDEAAPPAPSAQEPVTPAAPVEDDPSDQVITFPVVPPAAPQTPAASAPPEKPQPKKSRATKKSARAAAQAPAQEQPVVSQAAIPTAGLPPVEQEQPAVSQAAIPTTGLPPVEQAQTAADEEDEAPTDPALSTPDVLSAANAQAGDADAIVIQATGNNLPVPANSSALVPSSPQLPVYYEPIEPPRRRSWRGWIITGIIILLLIVLGVFFYRPVLDFFFPPTATVTITPDNQRVQHTYQMTAVLGVPDPTKNQVDARALYADSQVQSQTVKATGQGHTAGQQSHGVLTFYNTSTVTQTIPAGTAIFTSIGVAVVNDDTITLPALNTSQGLESMTDAAHSINVGANQNIPANTLNSQLCCGGSVYVSNPQAFSGGQDSQTFAYVQQSDIDGVTKSLSASLTQQATGTLQGQMRSTERPAGTPRCAPQVTSNHQAGDRSATVTVNVKMSCIGEVYDMQAVQALAAHDLTQDASTNPGPSYVPVGDVLAQVASATPDNRGNVALVVNAAGVWAYQFTPAQREQFAKLIRGKSSADAESILRSQTGVRGVTISLTGVGVTIVPNDTEHITISVEAVQGLHL